MSIRIVGLKNNLSTSSAPYYVRALPSDVVKPDELVRIMAKHPTTLTEDEIAICLLLFTQEIAKLVAEGKVVKTGLGSFYVNAAGTLKAPNQAFKPGNAKLRHSLRLGFRPDRGFEATMLARATVHRIEPCVRRVPLIGNVASLSGGFLCVTGKYLKFDDADPDQGLFFISKTETRATKYLAIAPSRVIARVPAGLQPGPFDLVLRSKQGGKLLRQGRSLEPWILA